MPEHAADAAFSNTTDFDEMDAIDVDPCACEWDVLIAQNDKQTLKGAISRKTKTGVLFDWDGKMEAPAAR